MSRIAQNQSLIKFLFVIISTLLVACNVLEHNRNYQLRTTETEIEIVTEKFLLRIVKNNFKIAFFTLDGRPIADYHDQAGLLIGESGGQAAPVQEVIAVDDRKDYVVVQVRADSVYADVIFYPYESMLKMQVNPQQEGEYDFLVQTGGIAPAYGMGDIGTFDHGLSPRESPELTGIDLDTAKGHRMISNFIIFPKHGFAEVNVEPNLKVVKLSDKENVNGSLKVGSLRAMYFLFGTTKEIYKQFLKVRNDEGYKVYKPKYEFFGVGWEAYGALAWQTNQKSVTENIDNYLSLGFPLEWAVLGSGFWPRGKNEFDEHGHPIYGGDNLLEEELALQATTSFGLWDKDLYPDPRGMIDNLHDKGLKFIIGLRIAFIPGGPFTDDGVASNYFISQGDGDSPTLFKGGFPVSEVYLLDTSKPEAVAWYIDLCDKWLAYGVDGFKEDLYGFTQKLPDDLIDPVNRALMETGVYIMGRSNYLGSPMDIHRYEDFNINQQQDRGPINGLAFAYAGFPYVYPDIVGGTGLATALFGRADSSAAAMYMMRFAQYAALNPSMSFGFGPWNFDDEVLNVCLNAALLHNRLQPHIYDAAIKAYQTGYPYTMTPLPVAFPEDANVYHLDDTVRRSYQWMIGESLLATPLFGDDYASAVSRNVYLPKGKWIDYDTGDEYVGPQTLENFPLPVGKTPLFVGGNGVVVEQIGKKIMARIYRTGYKGEVVFNYPNGETVSTINIKQAEWEVPTIRNTSSNSKVSVNRKGNAFEFELTPGESYEIK